MFPETNTAFLSSLFNFLVFEKPRSEISTNFFKATEKIDPRMYKGQWLTNPQPPPPPSLWRFFYIYIHLFFSVDDKTAAPDGFSNRLFFPRKHFQTTLVMVGVYGYDIWHRNKEMVKQFLSTNSCPSTSFNNRSKAGGWNDVKCLFMLFYMSSKKKSIYRGFILISNSR